MKKATQQQIKEQNRNLVLKIIFERPVTSRAEIASITHLTRATVSDIVADLLAQKLIGEVGIGTSIGGKSPILLSLEPDSRYIIGVDLAQNWLSGAVVNLRGQIREMITMPIEDKNIDGVLRLVYETLDALVKKAGRALVGIGLATSGIVSTKKGVVIQSVNLNWKDLPLGQRLEDRYHLPVYLLNDSHAAAMGEFVYGSNQSPAHNMVVIRAGHGIGAGIILNGELYQGDEGYAGEIGHIISVPEQGLLCRCGNYGCLETVASSSAVVQRAAKAAEASGQSILGCSPEEITLDILVKAFNEGDTLVQEIIFEAGKYMGMAVASLIGTLNIHRVVLTGSMTRFGTPWLDVVRKIARETILPTLSQEIRIEMGNLKDNEAVLGSAALLVHNYNLLFKDTNQSSGRDSR